MTCPGCGAGAVRSVPEVCADPDSVRTDLADRLAKAPAVTPRGDSLLHGVEGLCLVAVGVALAVMGMRDGSAVYTAGGWLLAVVMLAGTVVVVRNEARERAVVAAGGSAADRLWSPARYCPACTSVFCAGGEPWEGLLTPEQFQKLVWTEAGYGRQLEEKVQSAAVPTGILPGRGGAQEHA
ncbi:hypothetical protein OK074_6097 [Actinobacteria bacterium OK074]|nr:hypothetical protein OK074_6097 [Actinobacteria bacterium OK074]